MGDSNIFKAREPLKLYMGGELKSWQLRYHTYGVLNENKNNAILVFHSLSTSSSIINKEGPVGGGWWSKVIGPGLLIDTNKYFVICANHIGSCFGSTGPGAINPETGLVYGRDFPEIHFDDIAHAQQPLLNHLGIERCFAVVGGSMGGMLALTYAGLYPESFDKLLLMVCNHRPSAFQVMFRQAQREAITQDPGWLLEKRPEPLPGFISARLAAHLYYRGGEKLDIQFPLDANTMEQHAEQVRELYGYFNYNASRFAENFNVDSYYLLLNAMDNFNLVADAGHYIWANLKASTLVLSIDSDRLYPTVEQQRMVDWLIDMGVPVKHQVLSSPYGHDAFMVDADALKPYIDDFLG